MVIFNPAKAAVALSRFHILCVFSVFMWCDMKFVTAVFIFIVTAWKQAPSTLLAFQWQWLGMQGQGESDHVGCFHNKRVQTDPKRSGWMYPTAGCEKITPTCFFVRLWQIQHAIWVWTCSLFKCQLVFYLDNGGGAGVRHAWLSVHQVCLDGFSLLRVSFTLIWHSR